MAWHSIPCRPVPFDAAAARIEGHLARARTGPGLRTGNWLSHWSRPTVWAVV